MTITKNSNNVKQSHYRPG